MARSTVAVVVGLVLLVSTMVFGASAFTSTTIQRSSSIDVVTDANAIIALQDNTTGTLITESGGKVVIDLSKQNGPDGVNPDATYVFGTNSTSGAPTSHAFNVTNHVGSQVSLNFSYTGVADDNAAASNLEFAVYDGSSLLGAFTESSSLTGVTVADGETIYVVLTIETEGLTDGADLSGTVEIST